MFGRPLDIIDIVSVRVEGTQGQAQVVLHEQKEERRGEETGAHTHTRTHTHTHTHTPLTAICCSLWSFMLQSFTVQSSDDVRKRWDMSCTYRKEQSHYGQVKVTL